MTDQDTHIGRNFPVRQIQHVGSSWAIRRPIDRIPDDSELKLSVKITSKVELDSESESSAAIVKSMFTVIVRLDRANKDDDSDNSEDLARSSARYNAVIELPPFQEETAESDIDIVRLNALNILYPSLRHSVLEGIRLAGYPEPELPLTYDAYQQVSGD